MRVIVTGATKGIGKSITELFIGKGWDVTVCSRSEKDLKKLREELLAKDSKREILTFQADLSKKTETEAFGEFILSQWDQFDVLINNAGLFIPGEIHTEEEGALEQMIETNLYSAYHLTRKLVDCFIKNQKGHIINMCSIASIMAYPNGGSYSISKFAMLGFSKVLREELKNKGIKVTSVLPGATWSNSWEGALIPRERLMEPSDIAKVVWNAVELGDGAVLEEIIVRPLLGDL